MQDEPEISHSVREQEKDQRILQACEKVTGGGGGKSQGQA